MEETYTAYGLGFDGKHHEWRGLRKTQAIWRYHWLSKGRNHGFDLKEWGWSLDDGFEGDFQWTK